MSPSRSILLLGEGNFSFSASVCKFHSEAGSSITATCLQHQEEALQHEGAASNIQIITDLGGTVLFEVDCTKLEECTPLQGRRFDRVVFNFPHCGRKSGVKRNRELLKNFFLSCVQVLTEDGEVHVSLCNGQGGTPADQPKREWHNSWQVVAMAAEAQLILSAVQNFDSENQKNYKCTGYRSQDKGFHVEKALLHVFTRSLPYTSAPMVEVGEIIDGEKVHYKIPAELSDYVYRGFLSPNSFHPVKLVQDFLLGELEKDWLVSTPAESVTFLIEAKWLRAGCCGSDITQCYWIHLLQKDLAAHPERKDPSCSDTPASSADLSVTPDKVDKVKNYGKESVRCLSSPDADFEVESSLHMLRPCLLPLVERFSAQTEEMINSGGLQKESGKNAEDEANELNETARRCNGVTGVLLGSGGVVFRNAPVSPWAPPAFHELLLTGVFPLEIEPFKLLGCKLESLFAPYGVSIVTEKGGLHLIAEPMGLVGEVFLTCTSDNNSHVNIGMSLNLDLLAVLLFRLPDWRLLWSHDQRFSKHFALRPPPGTPFPPFCLFPEPFNFDISFWTGPAWEEKKFHAAVREASYGSVQQVKLIDMFSHPDLSQISYCYRLTYHSHTHALSHTQALQFHKQLESLLSTRLKVTIR